MKLIYKLFRLNPESRDDVIAVTSGLSIVANLFIAAFKILIGIIASSIAIISEGANNASDALTSILSIIGIKFAKKRPDKNHPFGYRRIEYLTGLVIAIVILVTGFEMLISSVKLIFQPEPLRVSYIAILIVAGSAIIKFALGVYTIKVGEKTNSAALKAVGVDGRNDSFSSLISIVSSLVFLLFHFSLDAYAGIIISGIIIKAGLSTLKETLPDLIGRPGEEELAEELYKEILETEGVLAAADMMLHNYGPDTWSGSVNIEIDHNMTVGEIYQIIHKLQLRILHEQNVTMVFGLYAVDNDSSEIKAIRNTIISFVKQHEHIDGFHALYLDSSTQTLYCDFTVDYNLKNWDELHDEFTSYIKEFYPQYALELTIETKYV